MTTTPPRPPANHASHASSSAGAVLSAHGLAVGYRSRDVVADLSLALEPGSITALVGPNGSGKSTLLAALARVRRPRAGQVRLAGRPLPDWPTREVARRLALLPQTAVAPPGATVRELVEQGRHPQLGAWAMRRRQDDGPVADALALTGLVPLADRPLEELSGGERQRAWIAMALAQQTELLLLDEPTSYLDVRHQLDLMQLVTRLRAEHGKTVVMVLHDLNQAARYADRLVALREGRVVADGPPARVLTAELLAEVFEVDAVVVEDPVSGRPMFVAR